MEKHKVIVAHNMLCNIEEIENELVYMASMKGEELFIMFGDCPKRIPIKTISLRNHIFELVRSAYEDDLEDLENRLKLL